MSPNTLVYPQTPPPPVPRPRDSGGVEFGATPIRVSGTAALQISSVPCKVTMITLEGGAAATRVRIFDSANLETTVDKRIGSVRAVADGYDGWSNGRGIQAQKGLVAQVDQADADCYIYIIPTI